MRKPLKPFSTISPSQHTSFEWSYSVLVQLEFDVARGNLGRGKHFRSGEIMADCEAFAGHRNAAMSTNCSGQYAPNI